MRYAAMGIALVLCLCGPVLAQEGGSPSPAARGSLQDSGVVSVDGKKIDAHYYTDGDKVWFPAVDVAKADGVTVTFDAASNHLTVDGKVVPGDVTVVNGAPYVNLNTLRQIVPNINLQNLGNGQAIFNHAVRIDLSKIGYIVINQSFPGQPVDITKFVTPGKFNVLDLYSDYCPPCRAWSEALKYLVQHGGNVVVRKFDINRPGVQGIDFDSPLAQQYKLTSVPHMVIYDDKGKLMTDDYQQVGNQLMKWLQQEGFTPDMARKAGLIQ